MCQLSAFISIIYRIFVLSKLINNIYNQLKNNTLKKQDLWEQKKC